MSLKIKVRNFGFVHGTKKWDKVKFVFNRKIYIMKVDGEVVGNCYIGNSYTGKTLFNLSIKPGFKRKGYGSFLLKYVELDNNLRALSLRPSDNDDGLREFYRKNGWLELYKKDDPRFDETNPETWTMFKICGLNI